MHIFDFRDQLIEDYASYINSFIQIRDPQINQYVQQKLQEGVLWPSHSSNSTPYLPPVSPSMNWWLKTCCILAA